MSSLEPVIDGRFNKAGFREVVCHDFRLARHDFGKPLLECARNLAVQLLPAALEKALIGRIPHQYVLEAIEGFRWLATAEHEPGLLELGECILQCGLIAPNQHVQQGIGKLASNHGTDLADLPHRRQAVEPRH